MSVVARIHAPVFRRRVRVLAALLAEQLPAAARVLDIGCGDGSVAAAILERRPDVTIRGLDLSARPGVKIPVEVYDGEHVPLADGEVDVAMLVDVVHHATKPLAVLAEAARVSGAVLIKDHLAEGWLAHPTLRFMDVAGNRHFGIATPFNYWREAEWRRTLAELGLTARTWRTELGLYPAFASWLFDRRLHFLARLERANG